MVSGKRSPASCPSNSRDWILRLRPAWSAFGPAVLQKQVALLNKTYKTNFAFVFGFSLSKRAHCCEWNGTTLPAAPEERMAERTWTPLLCVLRAVRLHKLVSHIAVVYICSPEKSMYPRLTYLSRNGGSVCVAGKHRYLEHARYVGMAAKKCQGCQSIHTWKLEGEWLMSGFVALYLRSIHKPKKQTLNAECIDWIIDVYRLCTFRFGEPVIVFHVDHLILSSFGEHIIASIWHLNIFRCRLLSSSSRRRS